VGSGRARTGHGTRDSGPARRGSSPSPVRTAKRARYALSVSLSRARECTGDVISRESPDKQFYAMIHLCTHQAWRRLTIRVSPLQCRE
jgi:hypothetical protein